MKQVNITAEARRVLEAYNLLEVGRGIQFRKPNPDGSYTIDLSAEVLERLEQHRFPSESVSDVLIQLCNRGSHSQ